MEQTRNCETIDISVLSLAFRNEANGYTVMDVINKGGDQFTAVGNAPRLGEGEQVKLRGQWTEHPTYGRQFAFVDCVLSEPKGVEQMERFLASGLIRACGPATAKAIVRKFQEDTADILQFAGHRLQEIPGIGPIIAQRISDSYVENMQMRTVIAGLADYGVTVGQAIRIAREYGTDGVMLVKENPYRLAEDIFGIGFKTADAIAHNMGIEVDSPARLRAGLSYALQMGMGEGHTYLPAKILCDYTANQLGVAPDLVERAAAKMVQAGELMLGKGKEEPVYQRMTYYIENECAVRLQALSATAPPPLRCEQEATIELQQQRSGMTLSPQQRQAVLGGAQGPVCVITGGPGTGKTTIVQFLLALFERGGQSVALCAPTGRAAKRMTQATGKEAKTIHRLLEYGRSEDAMDAYGRNEDKPLEEQVIIVDEMSMVDIFLMMRLLRAIKQGSRLILIGDSDQLPSVGPGNVLHDIIDCGAIPVVKLNVVYRQGEGSLISLNAQRINRGEMPEHDDNEFCILSCNDTGMMWDHIQALCKADTPQVIAPMRKGDMGVLSLNEKLQALLNPKRPGRAQLPAPWHAIREGDRVMQTKNDYRMEWEKDEGVRLEKGLGVFNGDMGVAQQVDLDAAEMTVAFEDGRTSRYGFAQTDSLDLAYAITIHKSQGSEFDRVIIALTGGPVSLYTRNLLYTAVTRAKKQLWIIGKPGALRQMVQNNRTRRRYSGLKGTLEELFMR